MKFFKQTIKGSCNIIAIQHVLSFFDKYPTFEDINKDLPVHEFGSWLPEIGSYLENKGIKTKLISNNESFTSTNDLFIKALDEYEEKGVFEDKVPTEADIKKRPVVINVDAFKIRKEEGGPGAHYVVLIKDNDGYYFYDGQNCNDKVKTSFDEIYKTSIDINEFHENGMWLVLV
jgi:hypothetical protein